jgi:hypothetical protein
VRCATPRSTALVQPGLLVLLTVAACAEVTIDSSRRPSDEGTFDPVAFIVTRGNTSARSAKLLQEGLLAETHRRGIAARALVLGGTDLDEEALIARAARGRHGLVFLEPAGGTRSGSSGELSQILWDVRAFRVLSGAAAPEGGDDAASPPDVGAADRGAAPAPSPRKTSLRAVWRARIDATGGYPEDQAQQIASKLVIRLIADGLLPGSPKELPPPAMREVAPDQAD